MQTHDSDKQHTQNHPTALFKSSIFFGGDSKWEILCVCPEARINTMEKCIWLASYMVSDIVADLKKIKKIKIIYMY